MKLYKIAKWNDLFENNRSRTVKDLAWVSIPNRHDGEHFSNIMQHKDGATIFAAFVLLVQVASKCAPRGTLQKDNGTPHTVRSLSAKCRCPASWFETSLLYLEHNTDWLDIDDVADGCQRPVSVLSASCQDDAKKEGNRKEGKKESAEALVDLFPEPLNNADFKVAWEDWLEYLKQRRKTPTDKTKEAQLKKLSFFGTGKAVAAIRISIENGWQGLFEPTKDSVVNNGLKKFRTNGTPGNPLTKEEEDAMVRASL